MVVYHSHLLFANDTLIFVEPNPDIYSLRALLLCFEAVSNLKVNLSKSEIVLVGSVNNLSDLAAILGYKVSSLPMKYLGLPLGDPHKSKAMWDEIVEKIEHKLEGWKRLYLSQGDKTTLIKSTLSNLSTYFLSLFPLPVGVAYRLEKIFRDFLWGSFEYVKKFHLIKWDKNMYIPRNRACPAASGQAHLRPTTAFSNGNAVVGKLANICTFY
ncbi:hypothetical protein F2P56_036096 [Juglans regia]|uniref:Reverse transcriptase domain-containing protein n=1 Tax=Juglans regia TaxID=51240 RepID=A0A833TQH8_JUGRE|nr:hypothetical protein F2P56_036096 [Juglans regia]